MIYPLSNTWRSFEEKHGTLRQQSHKFGPSSVTSTVADRLLLLH